MNNNTNNNGMIIYKENFISKVKNFFRRIFNKQENQYNYMPKETSNEIKSEILGIQTEFFSELKVDAKTVMAAVEKENFLREIDGNEEALMMLSVDRLMKLEEYYDDIIKQNVQKIKKLKEAV